ncbi:hypothetical protein SAMN04487944_12816 [Gracilibacillus ureilyticus]|uniref:Uncharacterized protein n=1 Tax=Gracilibacillus ureilyticus TaxID=531814 RepID=A0A1H9VV64_9BACI|nr:hypothetical protein [Gracilibacillus ureilyticus]SES25428.1 hypothetical protein SAMN04487944_12816 [Gracilibacillus ureilyticus]
MMRKKAKRSWYLVPFTGALFIALFSFLQVIYLRKPKAGPWSLPDEHVFLIPVGMGSLFFVFFVVLGCFGLYYYKKEKEAENFKERERG